MAEFPFRLNRRWTWILGGIAAVILLIVLLSYVIKSEALRKYAERQMNHRLKGYTVHIGRAYFHPITFSMDLEDLVLTQDTNPDPPVADIRQFKASVHWRELLSLHVVGNLLLHHPKLYVNLTHVRKEEESKVPLDKKGWQEAVEAIYPLKINSFRIRSGELTYVDQGPYKPLHVTGVNLHASNIRNIRSPDRVYPSSVYLEARIFDKGKLILDGYANFLQEPQLGFKGVVELDDMDLSYFKPILQRENLTVRKGTISVKGDLEYAPDVTEVNLKSLDIKGMDVDYLHLPETAGVEAQRVEKTAQTAKKLSNEPSSKIRADTLKLVDSSFGYVNKTTHPSYRVYADHMEGTLKHFSNQFVEGPATLDLKGKFMGSGDAQITGTFRSETKSPDFSLNVAVKDTDLISMRDLFRAHGNVDVTGGIFLLNSELTIKGNRVDGYVKPIFKEMKIAENPSAQKKGLAHKVYVGAVKGASKMLQNIPHKQVATKTDISGPIGSPGTNTFQVIVNLIRNAFIKAILPGFEKETSQPQERPPPPGSGNRK